MFFCSLVWRYYQIGHMDTWTGSVVLGLLLGLTILARIDTVFLVAILSAFLFWSKHGNEVSTRLAHTGITLAIAFLVSSPWWVYNLTGFGSVMPTSGTATHSWEFSLKRIEAAALSVYWVAIPPVVTNPIYPVGFDGEL